MLLREGFAAVGPAQPGLHPRLLLEQAHLAARHSSNSDASGRRESQCSSLPFRQYISEQHHCIAVDLPNHGDSVGFSERFSFAENMLDLLKEVRRAVLCVPLVTDRLCRRFSIDLSSSIRSVWLARRWAARSWPCSSGSTRWTSEWSVYFLRRVSDRKGREEGSIRLSALAAGEAYETAMLHELRAGTYHLILPESFEQLRAAIQSLSTKKVHLTRPLARNYLKTHRRTVEQHKRSRCPPSSSSAPRRRLSASLLVLQIAFERDYPNLAEIYGELRSLTSPTLILWGRDDQVRALFSSSSSPSACSSAIPTAPPI